jgi:hypothetical protein
MGRRTPALQLLNEAYRGRPFPPKIRQDPRTVTSINVKALMRTYGSPSKSWQRKAHAPHQKNQVNSMYIFIHQHRCPYVRIHSPWKSCPSHNDASAWMRRTWPSKLMAIYVHTYLYMYEIIRQYMHQNRLAQNWVIIHFRNWAPVIAQNVLYWCISACIFK